jgi:hypothetical protein
MDLRLDPLRMQLVRAFAPGLPLGGTLTGTATLDGSPAGRLTFRGDIVHDEGGQRSRVVGRADFPPGRDAGATVDARFQPLSLATAGRFAPGAGLHGAASGRVRLTGPLRELRVDAELDVDGGGAIVVAGTLDLAAARIGYDLDVQVSEFDLAVVTWRAPAATSLSGSIDARGRGFDPATMQAVVLADPVGAKSMMSPPTRCAFICSSTTALPHSTRPPSDSARPPHHSLAASAWRLAAPAHCITTSPSIR